MVKNSSKKRFEKDIPILKSKEIVNSVTYMENQIVITITFLVQYAQINFTKNLYLRNIGFLVIICFSWVRDSQQGI